MAINVRLLGTLLLLVSCASGNIKKYFHLGNIEPVTKREYKENLTDMIRKRAPDSIRYRRTKFYRPVRNGRRITVLCGQVNLKGRGGFISKGVYSPMGDTGYHKFVTNGLRYTFQNSAESKIIIECLCRNGEIPDHCK